MNSREAIPTENIKIITHLGGCGFHVEVGVN